jgi:hypothetical protein
MLVKENLCNQIWRGKDAEALVFSRPTVTKWRAFVLARRNWIRQRNVSHRPYRSWRAAAAAYIIVFLSYLSLYEAKHSLCAGDHVADLYT